ncbi:LPXTG cell wall anchor domain-containing protein [Streptococcus suis]|uniref:LPXTG cell wall anchor domain-containing protein n=1 Tax=Streptococcus suis TaxID=1307 RepID=UPI001ABE9E6C|nr:LPXTG cell wall anchor domain-containing protein [Streptococcus suis]MBO4108816.1 LPXTG cell wall anchor domain-containing protein [Streptococcus suis]
MKKKQLLAALALSTVTLAQSNLVSADEATSPVDNTAPVVVLPTDPTTTPVETPETPSEQPTQPTTPSENTSPTVPVDPTAPSTDSTTDPSSSSGGSESGQTEPGTSEPKEKEGADTVPTEPSTTPDTPDKGEVAKPDETAPDKGVTVPTTDGGTAILTPDVSVPTNNPKVTADQAQKAGASQVGTTSQVTGQIVQAVTPQAPVQTITGASIVSTEGGQVLLSDGSLVAPETVGATTNADKTITVTKADGSKATLPHTGEEQSVLALIGGLLLAALAIFQKKTRKA